ncbi:hypothetical protein Cadr_000022531, partial [Camelus dromedarius]
EEEAVSSVDPLSPGVSLGITLLTDRELHCLTAVPKVDMNGCELVGKQQLLEQRRRQIG